MKDQVMKDEVINSEPTLVMTEQDALEIFVTLLASARTQLDDPHHYGSMRLLAMAERLREAVIARCSPEMREMLQDTTEQTQHAQLIVNRTEPYTEALDQLNAQIAQFLVEREGL